MNEFNAQEMRNIADNSKDNITRTYDILLSFLKEQIQQNALRGKYSVLYPTNILKQTLKWHMEYDLSVNLAKNWETISTMLADYFKERDFVVIVNNNYIDINWN